MGCASVDTGSTRSRQFLKVNEILQRFNRDSRRLIAILQAVQDAYRYLPQPVLNYLATSLGIPRARVYGVATFYAHFSLEPKGKYIIRICDGTACHVNHSQALLDLVSEKLGIDQEKPTSDDLLFTVERVSCIGACGLAPVAVVNDLVYGQLAPAKLGEVLDELIRVEKGI
ncbi:MAG TPA: NAD(P)H-dependent oxidoreductase subunit E [Clostridiales bacterium UBA8153]|nr:NAD(P)H-dependent oxidoreductase subunit E [Clostridiales bacterium UBA8153]